jgi:tetratricopeptide (TPR) repeat protein
MKRTRQALEVLSSVIDRFPDEPWLHYRLACYASQLGDLKAAWEWLERALRLDPNGDMRRLAQEDTNLRPIWTENGRHNDALD